MPATFKFYLRDDRPNKRGLCPVYLRITYNRKKKYHNTGIRIHPNDWNERKEEVRKTFGKESEVHDLNKRLGKIRGKAEKAYWDLDSDRVASADGIKRRLENFSKDNFFVFAEEYQEEIEKKSFYTWKQNKVAIDKVRKFHGSNDLPFGLIDTEFLNKLVTYLQSKPYNNKATTIHKNFAAIKAILDKAVLAKLIPSNPMEAKEFNLPKKSNSTSKTKLSLEQINAIEDLKLKPGSNIWHSRNAFLLAFYFCGMRFGDIAELTWEHVKNGRLSYDMNKTGTSISIPIKSGAQAILGRYKEDENNGYIFPFLAGLTEEQRKKPDVIRKKISSWNAIVNGKNTEKKLSGLKKIAKLAEIDEDISMHVARHSFAQYGVNDKEIPPYKMMMLLGHKSVKTTMQYLKSLDLKTVDNVMDEIF
jgi:integrase